MAFLFHYRNKLPEKKHTFFPLWSLPPYVLYGVLGSSNLPEHRVQSSLLSGAICGCLSAWAFHCGCCQALWPAGMMGLSLKMVTFIRKSYFGLAFWHAVLSISHNTKKWSLLLLNAMFLKCLIEFMYLFLSGAHWSHLSYPKFWVRSELFHERRCTCWSVPPEHALRANSEPAHCHVFLSC